MLTALVVISALAGMQPAHAQVETNAFVSGDEKWNQLIKDGQSALDNDKAMPAIGVFKRALSQIQRAPQPDQVAIDRMTAISNVKLGKAYAAKGEYQKADAAFKEAKTAYDKLSIDDAELRTSTEELTKHFKSIDPNSLGDSVTSYLKEANVSAIAVFPKEEGDLVEISLPQKYVKPIDSKDVSKVSFNKKVSFQFLTKPNGDYQVKKIQGMQVLAKTLWVNLLESLVKVGTTPVAEVTAGKMGVTKTVSVNIPVDMYNSTKQILDNLIATIKGQPAYAATGETKSPSTVSTTSVDGAVNGNLSKTMVIKETEASVEPASVDPAAVPAAIEPAAPAVTSHDVETSSPDKPAGDAPSSGN